MTPTSTVESLDHWSLERLTRALHYAPPPERTAAAADTGATTDATRRDVMQLLQDPRTRAGVVALLRLRCRDWWMRSSAALADLGGGASQLDVRTALGRDEFLGQYYFRNRPVSLPGLARYWPAVSKWTADYLAQFTVRVDVMFDREQAPVHERSIPSRFTRSMPFSDFVRLVYSGRRTDNYYLVAKNRFFDIPELRGLLDDIVCPSFLMIGEGPRQVGAWFGPAATYTPIHYDDMNTVLVQIIGRKRIRLYSPLFAECMEQRQQWHGEIDPALADPATHPAISRVSGADVTLGPGDALFIPVGWWHAVEAQDVSFSLSFKEFGVLNDFGSAFTDPAVRTPQHAE